MDENHQDNRINPKVTTLSKVLKALLSGNIGQVPLNISQGERQLCLKIIGVMQSNKLINEKEKTRANKQIQNSFSLSAFDREEQIVEQNRFQKNNAYDEENVRISSTVEIWNEFEAISKQIEEDCLQIRSNYQIKNHLSQQMVNQQLNQEQLLQQTIKQLTIQIEENAIKLANEKQKNNKLMVANANHSNQINRHLKQIKQLQVRIRIMELEKENIGKNKSMYDQSLILKIKEIVKQFSKQQKMHNSQSSCENSYFIQEQQQDRKDKGRLINGQFIQIQKMEVKQILDYVISLHKYPNIFINLQRSLAYILMKLGKIQNNIESSSLIDKTKQLLQQVNKELKIIDKYCQQLKKFSKQNQINNLTKLVEQFDKIKNKIDDISKFERYLINNLSKIQDASNQNSSSSFHLPEIFKN